MRYFLLPVLLLLATALCAQLTLQPFAEGFTFPVDLMSPSPADDRLFVVEKPGRIYLVEADGTRLPTPFLNIVNQVNDTGGEMGLLGLEFSPNYAQDGYFFTNYTNVNGDTRVSRWQVSATDPNVADPASEVILLEFDQPYSNHNGGDLAFGPDGYLYISTGDGGLGGDPQNNSQDRTNLLGKILRIDVLSDPAAGYLIPADNPFVSDPTTRDEFWALGLRNPWRISFDALTGDLWIADVGQNAFEEVNFQAAGSAGGQNYGWRCYEGNAPFNTGGCPAADALTFPVHTYTTSGTNPGCSVTGGQVYRGCDFPAWQGKYLYTDFCSGRFWTLTPDGNGGFVNEEVANAANYEFGSIGVFQRELYAASHNEGAVYRLVPTATPPLALDAEVAAASCATVADGSINLTLTQPLADATYLWSDGSTAADRTDLTAGTYGVTVSYGGDCTLEGTFDVVLALPAVPTIEQQGNTLLVPDGYASYQWLLDGQPIDGATGPSYEATTDGLYTVEVTETNGCMLTTPELSVMVVGTALPEGFTALRVAPNPFAEVLTLEARLLRPTRVHLRLYDAAGRVHYRQRYRWTGAVRQPIELPALSAGVYWLEVRANGSRTARRVVRR